MAAPHTVNGGRGNGELGEADRSRPALERRAARANGDRERKLVLVVDDEAHDREVYGRILLYNGFDVAFAENCAAAQRLLEEHRPDLVLLDLSLPDGTGLEVCTAVRHTLTDDALPVVVLSAFTRDEMGARTLAAGANEFIEKPASPVAVLHTIESYLGEPPLPGDGKPPVVVAEALSE